MIDVWLNRCGLLLQFVSVFLMAPEVVGVERLQRIRKTVSVGQQLSLYLPLGIGLVLIVWAVTFRELAARLHRTMAAGIVSGVALAVALLTMQIVRRHMLQRLVEDLKDQEVLRKRLLTTGAVCFTVGFLLQFASTFR